MDRVPFEKVSQGVGIGEVVNCANLLDLILRHGAQHIAPDAAEAVDAEICHMKS